MEIVTPHAAGIDIGSRSHWVSTRSKRKDIKEFDVFNEDLQAIANWLEENKVTTIAMESTGAYWQALYAVLISRGFLVILCNGKFTKNIKGRKTDIQGGRPVTVREFKNCSVLELLLYIPAKVSHLFRFKVSHLSRLILG